MRALASALTAWRSFQALADGGVGGKLTPPWKRCSMPASARRLIACRRRAGALVRGERLQSVRALATLHGLSPSTVVQALPMIPALKAVVAHHMQHAGWTRVRPPLTAFSAEQANALLAQLDALEFSMPPVDQVAA